MLELNNNHKKIIELREKHNGIITSI